MRLRKTSTILRFMGTSALFLVVCSSGTVWAQPSEPVQIVKEGSKYMYQGKQIKGAGDLKPIVANLPEAAAEAGKSSTYHGVATAFAVVGGALVGWPIGQAIGGNEDPQWVLAGAGAGAVAIGILFELSSGKHFEKAIDLYNGRVDTSASVRTSLHLAIGPGGLAVVAGF